MPLPGNFSTVPVHGKYLDLAGAALAGTVTFTATPDALTDPAALIIIMSKPLVMTLDVNGEFTTNLPATDDPDIDPIGFTYKVVEAFPGRDVAGREYYITVPVASLPGGIDLTTAAPAIPVDGVARGQFLNDLGDVDTTGAVTDSPLVRDSTGEWVAGPALSATFQPLPAGFLIARVETYGALGDGTTDDTPPILSARDAVDAAGGGIVLFGPKVYLVNGALITANGGNAIIPFPDHRTGTPGGHIIFLGTSDPQNYYPVGGATTGTTVIKTTKTGVTYGANGPACVMGSANTESTGLFSNQHVTVENIAIVVPDNSTLAGLDLSQQIRATVRGVNVVPNVAQASITQPSHSWAFGVRMPANNNYDTAYARNVVVSGMACGFVANEHCDADQIVVNRCLIGLGVQGGYHNVHLGYVSSEWNTYHIGTYDPSVGLVTSLTPASYGKIDCLDIEYAPSGWWQTTLDIYDPGSSLHWEIDYLLVQANVGVITQPLSCNGAANVTARDKSIRPLRLVSADTGARADSAVTLGNADTGPAWTTQSGAWGTNGKKLYCATPTGSPGIYTAVLPAVSADGAWKANVTLGTGTVPNLGVVFRNSSDTTHLFGQINGDQLFLYKKIAGTYTALGSTAHGTLPTANADGSYDLDVYAFGAKIFVQVNRQTLITYSTSTGQEAARSAGLITHISTSDDDGTSRVNSFRQFASV